MPERMLNARELQALTTLYGLAPRARKGGNVNALQHGYFANRILGEEELQWFLALRAHYQQRYGADLAHASLAALHLLQSRRALRAEQWWAFTRLDRRWRHDLRGLRADQRQRAREAADAAFDPGAWATPLLANLAARRAADGGAAAPTLPVPSVVPTARGLCPDERSD